MQNAWCLPYKAIVTDLFSFIDNLMANAESLMLSSKGITSKDNILFLFRYAFL